MTQDAATSFLMGSGGPKSIFNKYDQPGTVKGGTILSWVHDQQRDMVTNEPKMWPLRPGQTVQQPMMQLIVTLQTDLRDATIEDDTGLRRLFVKGYMTKAIRDAIKTADSKMLEQGGQLWVRYDGDDVPSGPGVSGAKMWSATYVPAPIGYGSTANDSPVAPVATAPVVPPSAPPAPSAPVAPPAPHVAEGAAVAALAAQGMVAPDVAAQAVSAGAVVPPAAPVAPPVGGGTPTVPSGPPADLAAALAALSPEERAAMGLPPL